jgi:Phosphatidylinositol-4-phosphate 5-kinase
MRKINNQIFEDTRFLAKHNIMDYSLLLIVETNPDWVNEHELAVKKRKEEEKAKKAGTLLAPGPAKIEEDDANPFGAIPNAMEDSQRHILVRPTVVESEVSRDSGEFDNRFATFEGDLPVLGIMRRKSSTLN